MAAAIDGRDGRSWHLPLPPLTSTSLEPHAPGAHGRSFHLREFAWMCALRYYAKQPMLWGRPSRQAMHTVALWPILIQACLSPLDHALQ